MPFPIHIPYLSLVKKVSVSPNSMADVKGVVATGQSKKRMGDEATGEDAKMMKVDIKPRQYICVKVSVEEFMKVKTEEQYRDFMALVHQRADKMREEQAKRDEEHPVLSADHVNETVESGVSEPVITQ